jgi:hypothetical protein
MTTDNKVIHQSYVDDKFAFDVALITLPVPIATNGSKKSIAHLSLAIERYTIAIEWKNTFVIVYRTFSINNIASLLTREIFFISEGGAPMSKLHAE